MPEIVWYPNKGGDYDAFRWCIYCGCDCWLEEPIHRDDCPSETGVFPYPGPCGLMPGEPETVCSKCKVPFREAGFYVQVPMEPIDDTPCYSTLCVGCGALEAVARGH